MVIWMARKCRRKNAENNYRSESKKENFTKEIKKYNYKKEKKGKKMTNYDMDIIETQDRCDRFEHAINCMDISPIAMMSFERVAKENSITLKHLLETWLLNALDRELSKDNPQSEFSFMEDSYG